MSRGQSKHGVIFLIDKDSETIRLTREALSESTKNVGLHTLETEGQVSTFLERDKASGEAARPSLILLHLADTLGYKLLTRLKTCPSLKLIPTVVLSPSLKHEDITLAYDLHANCYIPKPPEAKQFKEVISVTVQYWFDIAKLPALS